MKYWLHSNGQTLGPYDGATIKSMTSDGQLSYNDLVCLDGTDNWTSIKDTFFPPVPHIARGPDSIQEYFKKRDAFNKQREEIQKERQKEEEKQAYLDQLKQIWNAIKLIFGLIVFGLCFYGY